VLLAVGDQHWKIPPAVAVADYYCNAADKSAVVIPLPDDPISLGISPVAVAAEAWMIMTAEAGAAMMEPQQKDVVVVVMVTADVSEKGAAIQREAVAEPSYPE